jgi:plastocyanin
MRARQQLAFFLAALGLSVLGAACGGGETGGDSAATPAASGGAPEASGAKTPDPGGKVITVEMVTDEEGNNKFVPAEFEAHRGDVIRYTLVQGVHNAHFLPDSNPGVQGLPAMGPLLQMPGQTYDVKVTWGPGKYFYQCDPHALLGMVGRVEVEEEK